MTRQEQQVLAVVLLLFVSGLLVRGWLNLRPHDARVAAPESPGRAAAEPKVND